MKRRRLWRKTPAAEAMVEDAPAVEAAAEEAPAVEAIAEDAPFEDATAEDLAWMDEPVEEAESDSDDLERLDAILFQYANCPTAPPHDCHMLQWWFRFLRPYTGPPPVSRWGDIRR